MDSNVPDASLPSGPRRSRDDDRKSTRSVRSFKSDSSDVTLVAERSPPTSPYVKSNPVKRVSPPSSPLAKQFFSALSRVSSTESLTDEGTSYSLIADDTHLYGDDPPVPIGRHLYKTAGGSSSEIPVPFDTFDMLLRCPGAVWVNILPFIHSLYPVRQFRDDFERKLGLVRRPSGFGQSLLETAAMLAFSIHSETVYRRFFGPSPSLKDHYLTLLFDLADIFTKPTENYARAMNTYMSGVLKDFLRTFAPQLNLSFKEINESSPSSSLAIFDWAKESVYEAGYHIIVTVDNFNVPLINSTPETMTEIAYAIASHLVYPISTGIDDQIIAGGMILGNPEAEEPSWVRDNVEIRTIFDPIARDISHEACVHGAFGYTWDQIKALADEVLPTPEEYAECLEIIQHTCAKHQDPDGKYVEYSVDDVLTRLREQRGLPVRIPSPELIHYGSDDEDW